MIIKTFIEPPIDNNNYLVVDEETKEAALIDCSAIDDNIRIAIKELGAKLKYILLTHGHFDHIAGIREHSAEVVMHEADMNWVKNVNQFMPMFGMPDMTIPKIDKFINDGDTITLGNIEIKVLHTPGHTLGGVCYLVDGVLFSGDTIFRESVGRCDLEGGSFTELVNSIETKIYTLPEETQILPGHGKPTTVGWEKLHNSYL